MKNSISTLVFAIVFIFNLNAQQFDLTGEVRPRFENKHGFKSLIGTDVDGSNFISQRSRLNFMLKKDKINFKLTLQNVRVWGDVSTLSSDDHATALHESWAEAKLSDMVSLKLGRQEIVYDDHRIFGSVGWAQQARSHDAFLIKLKPNDNHKLDLGLALNADNQAGIDNLYSGVAGYKTFQYLWYHGDFEKVGLSFLALNTGNEYMKDSVTKQLDYMQTVGPRLTYKGDKFSANAATYVQMGKSTNIDVNALYYAANLAYKLTDNFLIGAGMEYLSGKDQDDTKVEFNSFAPLFGTNHKFNGWMDYFYVGNHGNSVGLTDISATLAYKKDAFSAKLIPHMFSTAANMIDIDGKTRDANLGTEVDFTLGYKISKEISFNAGYSQMMATETMEALKGGDKDEQNSWGWVMFTFKPHLFSAKSND